MEGAEGYHVDFAELLHAVLRGEEFLGFVFGRFVARHGFGVWTGDSILSNGLARDGDRINGVDGSNKKQILRPAAHQMQWGDPQLSFAHRLGTGEVRGRTCGFRICT